MVDKPHWTNNEIKILQENYERTFCTGLMELLPNRSLRSINHKALRISLQKPRELIRTHKEDYWTKEEKTILEELYPNALKEIILNKLPGRGWQAIRHSASRLGISRRVYFSQYMSIKAKKEHYINHIDLSAIYRKPNKAEIKVMELLEKLHLPYCYVGDGKVIIGGYTPDFIHTNNKNHIIEVFGDYWHNRENMSWHQTELGRIMAYSHFGYKTLVIWEHELADSKMLKEKLLQFEQGKRISSNGEKSVKVSQPR